MTSPELEGILPPVFYGAELRRETSQGEICWTYDFDVALIDVDCRRRGARIEMSMNRTPLTLSKGCPSYSHTKVNSKREVLDALNDVWLKFRDSLRLYARYYSDDDRASIAAFLAIEDHIPDLWERLHAG